MTINARSFKKINIKQKIKRDGITYSLSVQASCRALRDLLEDESYVCKDEELEDLFLQNVEPFYQQLCQARKELLLNLMKSYSEHLKIKTDDIGH